jgi:hypothetical protein
MEIKPDAKDTQAAGGIEGIGIDRSAAGIHFSEQMRTDPAMDAVIHTALLLGVAPIVSRRGKNRFGPRICR